VVGGTGAAAAAALGAVLTFSGGGPWTGSGVALEQASDPLLAPKMKLPDPPPAQTPEEFPPPAQKGEPAQVLGDGPPADLKEKLLIWNQGRPVKLSGKSGKPFPPAGRATKKKAAAPRSKTLSAKTETPPPKPQAPPSEKGDEVQAPQQAMPPGKPRQLDSVPADFRNVSEPFRK
jgi:hypothetical protein